MAPIDSFFRDIENESKRMKCIKLHPMRHWGPNKTRAGKHKSNESFFETDRKGNRF